ncbi:hypothetical protein HDU87_002102 [Geranomyces variabilis]|uniref:Uncharacterized protein n=1 Tax=Geranomyces variabilis TaxID=109894 RepID=A0AAD5TRJ0_9FUNG|nr:hypothetical protein HDU87_002102 [Geranomyces variabilis]
MLLLLKDSPHLHAAFAFLDWSADVFFNIIYTEQRSPITSDSPRAAKRARRELTVLQDFDRIMDAKTPRDERIGLLQVLAVMAAKHSFKMEAYLTSLLAAKLEGLLRDGDMEISGWALMCGASLPACPQRGRSQRLTGWNIALKLAVADAPSAAAGFYLLEREIERGLMSISDIADAFVQAGNAMINGTIPTSSSMLRFFTAYLKWSASNPRESANQSVLQCDVFAWLLKHPSSNVHSVLEYYAAMCGAFRIKDQGIHREPARTEEFLSEQRLLSSRRLCKLAAEEDVKGLAENERSKLCTLHSDPRIAAVLRDHVATVLQRWRSSGASSALMTDSLAVFMCGTASAQLPIKSDQLASTEEQAFFLSIRNITEYMAEAFPRMTSREATAFLSDLAEGLAAIAIFRASSNAEVESAESDAATPLVRSLAAALRSCSTDMDLDAPNASSAHNVQEPLDDFDAPVVGFVNNASGGAQAVPIGGQLQFYYDASALEGAQIARDIVFEYRCLSVLCQLLWSHDLGDQHHGLWKEACDALMEMLPVSLDGITIRGDDTLEFLEFAATRGLSASMETNSE